LDCNSDIKGWLYHNFAPPPLSLIQVKISTHLYVKPVKTPGLPTFHAPWDIIQSTMIDWILYADPAILVVNKPAGLRSLQDGYDKTLPHLLTVLEPEYGSLRPGVSGDKALWMVHRLDRETSGVLVIARSVDAHRSLNTQFMERQVHKTYHALVAGDPPWDETQIDLPLRKDGDRSHRTVVDPKRGKAASTSVEVLERFGAITLVAAHPHTGYTHQIRAHLTALGFPLVGDGLYNREPLTPLPPSTSPGQPCLDRLALHALSIAFIHPTTGLPVEFSAPYPSDFTAALDWLRSSKL
jgi:RluA family pseudouridine synthase